MDFLIFSGIVAFRGSFFVKAIENFFPLFAQPLSCLYQAMQTWRTFTIA